MERDLHLPRGVRSVRTQGLRLWGGSLLALAAVLPLPALAASSRKAAPAPVAAAPEDFAGALQRLLPQQPSDKEIWSFYAARNFRPLWASAEGAMAARDLVQLIASSTYDSIDPATVNAAQLSDAAGLLASGAPPASLAAAELNLSRAFVRYVVALRQAKATEMVYEHVGLRPSVPTAYAVLADAAKASALADYVRDMRWMHPLYAPLRRALASGSVGESEQRLLLGSLERIRALPASVQQGRYVLVDAANARLWMYEGDRPVDSMKVVVGKVDQPTPMMAGYIRHAIVNPYWNVPQDLTKNKIAPNVLRQGIGYLKARSYQVLPDWSPEAEPIDPKSVDWRAVVDGTITPRIRQLPTATNAMGKVKFEFPNALGIYLHDTPEKNLMLEEQRQLSAGCIRLEDAQRLGRWLFRGAMTPPLVDEPEQKVELPELVPVFVTYLTAHPEDGRIALGSDPYKRDALQAAGEGHQVAMNAIRQ